jgi:anti-anti-sigma factor
VNAPIRTAAPAAPPFTCTVSESKPGHATAVLCGDLDLANSPLLRDELLRALTLGVTHLRLDLGALTFIDSSGVAALIVVRRSATEHGAELEITAISRLAQRVFDSCGVAELFAS